MSTSACASSLPLKVALLYFIHRSSLNVRKELYLKAETVYLKFIDREVELFNSIFV